MNKYHTNVKENHERQNYENHCQLNGNWPNLQRRKATIANIEQWMRREGIKKQIDIKEYQSEWN